MPPFPLEPCNRVVSEIGPWSGDARSPEARCVVFPVGKLCVFVHQHAEVSVDFEGATKSLSQLFGRRWKRGLEPRNPACISDVCTTLTTESFPVECYVLPCHISSNSAYFTRGVWRSSHHSISKVFCEKRSFCYGTLSILVEYRTPTNGHGGMCCIRWM